MRIVKKTELPALQNLLVRLGAALCALLATALLMMAFGYNPILIYSKILEGSTGTGHRLVETIHKTIPLIVLSLGIAVAFKMKFWNIGAEGQFYMGACGATYIALNYAHLPKPIVLSLMILTSIIFGGLWALFPAFLKHKFSASETLVTLMMNYIAVRIVTFLQYGPWKDPSAIGFPKIALFHKNAILPKFLGVHIGWIFALVLCVLIYILFTKTKLGYEIAVIGENEKTARYAGMNIVKILVISIFISGGLCGFAGMMQSSAIEKSLTMQMSGGMGFTAIITSWLARLSPPAIMVVSFLFAMLIQGGMYLQSSLQIPAAVSGIIQGLILFFVLGSEFFTKYKIVFANK